MRYTAEKHYCFSAATEESTACTKSHAINKPTNAHMYKQTNTDILHLFFSFLNHPSILVIVIFLHIEATVSHIIYLARTFSIWLQLLSDKTEQ